jgi:hypothetical protein
LKKPGADAFSTDRVPALLKIKNHLKMLGVDIK